MTCVTRFVPLSPAGLRPHPSLAKGFLLGLRDWREHAARRAALGDGLRDGGDPHQVLVLNGRRERDHVADRGLGPGTLVCQHLAKVEEGGLVRAALSLHHQ
eukprot:965503-Pyramimonas_sp.AAC.1